MKEENKIKNTRNLDFLYFYLDKWKNYLYNNNVI